MNLFKTALLATVCVVAASTSSLAAKGTGSWGGAYAGLSVGYMNDRSALQDTGGNYSVGIENDIADGSASNLEFGGQVGYNWQDGRMVYGLEADAFGVSGETLLGSGEDDAPHLGQTINTTTSLRARFGLTMDNDYMVYGTAGGASLQTTSHHWDDDSNYDGANRYYFGWTAGLGAEKKIASNYSAKLEGRYSNFAEKKWQDPVFENFGADPQTWSITAGVNYHF